MSRIAPLNDKSASPVQAVELARIETQMGGVPNVLATLAHSPAALNSYLNATHALAQGSLDAKARERIALVTAAANQDDYGASAHSQIARQAGLSRAEIDQALHGKAESVKDQALLDFARAVAEQRGQIDAKPLKAARKAGWSDAALVEVIALVGINTLTGYLNHVAKPDFDFPLVLAPALDQAA